MRDEVTLVTGAGEGIGRAIAMRLAREGAAIVVADSDEVKGAEVARQVEADGGRAAFIRVDVASEEGARGMVAFAQRRFGGLDALVNNAGGVGEPFYPEAEPGHWGRALDVNLRGVMLGIQFALPAMRERGAGAIVNVSSMAGVDHRPYDIPEYAAAKAAVVRLTTALAFLEDEANVRVNCICPGWVETEKVKEALAHTSEEQRSAQPFPPPAAPIHPDELAEAVLGLVRDETLAGRVMVWPDGQRPRLLPTGSAF